ncbi:MAG: glutaredoxin family protein [Anaerolineae bacterium]
MYASVKHVAGKNVGQVMMYALSTCVWCKKTKALLNALGVEYDYIDVDLLTGQERTEVTNEVARWNPQRSFPTIVVNNSKVIVGYDELKINQLAEGQGAA